MSGDLLRVLTCVAVVGLAACKNEGSFPRTTEAVGPTAARWQRATLEVTSQPGFTGVHGSVREALTYQLTLHGASDVRLDVWRIDIDSRSQRRALRGAPERLRFAGDGHALAFSVGGERAWRYVALDAGDTPFYSRRWTFGTDADPFAGAPSTRDLVLGALRAPAGGENELPVPAKYACDHPEDDDLRGALVSALGSGISDSVVDPIIACVGRLARTRADVRTGLVLRVGAPEADGELAFRAARALAACDDAGVADALASALRHPAASRPDADGLCRLRAGLTWSLASVVNARSVAPSTAVVAALSDVALAPDACPGFVGLGTSARIYAVRGLAVVRSIEGRRPLSVLAGGACGTPLASWPPQFVRWNEEMDGTHSDLACWAQAALARQGATGND